MTEELDLFHSCALAAFIDALPMDDGHSERARRLAYQYYERELKNETRERHNR